MTTYVGNCAHLIDWDSVIQNLYNRKGDIPAKQMSKIDSDEIQEIVRNLKDWPEQDNFWENFYARTGDYLHEIDSIFADFINCNIARAWIAKVKPGWQVPWHWDWDENEREYLSRGELLRFHCHMSDPKPGQVTIVKDTPHFKVRKGDVFMWNSYRDWHGSSNCGYHTKFTYHFLGNKR